MPKRKSKSKKLFLVRFNGKNFTIFNSVRSFLVFLARKKMNAPRVLPITSELYCSTGSCLGKKLTEMGVTPLVYTENPLLYLNDEVAILCQKTEKGLPAFLNEVYKSCKHNELTVPETLVWQEYYFT